MQWDGNNGNGDTQRAYDALEAFEVRASPTFLSDVMQAAVEQPRRRSWFNRLLLAPHPWAPAALCVVVVLTLGSLLGLNYIDWPFVGKTPFAPIAAVTDERSGVIMETELTTPLVAFTAGLPMYYALHRGFDRAVAQPF